MRWDDFRRSDNVEDSRGDDGGLGGGSGMGIPIGGGGLGIGTVIILGLIGWALGINPSLLIGGAELVNSRPHHAQPYEPASQPNNRQANRPDGRFRCCRARKYRGHVDRHLQGQRPAIQRAASAALLRRDSRRLWLRTGGNGAVLLS